MSGPSVAEVAALLRDLSTVHDLPEPEKAAWVARKEQILARIEGSRDQP